MDFNKIKEMGLEYAEKGKNAAMELAEKGKTQAMIVNEQGKLLKAQRQLGALVYSLAKGKEENQPLVDKYIEMIDSIEQEITRLKASLLRWSMSSMVKNLQPSPKPPQKSLPRRNTRPARSAVHRSQRMHCSAISAVHSCNPIDPAAGRRSPQGSVLFL